MNDMTPAPISVERFDLYGVSYVRATDHDASITALLHQLAEIRDDLASLQVVHNCLRRDHERARANERRYLWLRHGDNDECVLRTPNGKPACDSDGPSWFLLRNEELDALIDKMIGNAEPERNDSSFLRDVIDSGRQQQAELLARAEAAERAREEACGLLREVEAETELTSIAEGIHPLNDSLRDRIAAFLAASGGKVDG